MKDIIELIHQLVIGHLDRLFAYFIFAILFYTQRIEIIKTLKGGNGVYQMLEIVTGVCLVLFTAYSIEIIYNPEVKADLVLLTLLLTGAGGGQIVKEFAQFKKGTNDKP